MQYDYVKETGFGYSHYPFYSGLIPSKGDKKGIKSLDGRLKKYGLVGLTEGWRGRWEEQLNYGQYRDDAGGYGMRCWLALIGYEFNGLSFGSKGGYSCYHDFEQDQIDFV